MFFIIGTGRCGTLSLANTLLEQTNCVCLHEPEPSLIEEAAGYRYGTRSATQIKALLLDTRLPMLNGKTYGEANQTLALTIPPLNETFPEAHFLWLMRSGLDVVASVSGRGWYTGRGPGGQAYEQSTALQRRWIDHRIRGDRCGDVDADEWAAMDPFEKCCWYWQYVNHTIERDLQAHVPAGRYRRVTLEGLEEQLDEVAVWLGLERLRRGPVAHHNGAGYAVHAWTGWGVGEWEVFERWCGPLMDRFYPQWREATGRDARGAGGVSGAAAHVPHVAHTDALMEEGETRFQDGDVAGARECFERAAAQDPGNPTLLNNLAVSLWADGDVGQALLHAARGLELAPEDRNLVINGGRILQSCDRGADAVALYESYLADFPDDADVRHALEELEEAVQQPGASPGVPAGDADALNSAGERHFSDGDIEEAEACFRRALDLAPTHVDVLNNLGVVLWQRGDQGEALDFLRRALEHDPERRETIANLALVLQGMGQQETLAALLGAYVQSHPDDDEMRALLDAHNTHATPHAASTLSR